MEAKELRVGNLVFFPLKDIPALILRDMFEYQNGLANLEDYRGIPLTEEWLFSFGFKHYGQGEAIFCHKKIYLYYRNNIFYFHKTIRFEILYVHQLQNLYFALTGLELEYEQN